jgi:peptidoglycan/LPS O-acetylase OafA/YrhL
MYFIAGIFILLYFYTLKRALITVAFLTVGIWALDHYIAHGWFDALWITGIVFLFCFWRYLGHFAKRGDFSYGVYIIHWPILQVLVALRVNRLDSLAFLGIALPTIGIASVLLWRFVESRFLITSSHYRAQAIVPRLTAFPLDHDSHVKVHAQGLLNGAAVSISRK